MKFTTKLKELWAYVPKRAAAVTLAVAGVVAAVAVPTITGAWGPNRNTYTINDPADHVTFDSITDNPNYGDERNFLSVRDTDSKYWDPANKNGWRDIQDLQEGHTYEIMMYVHNNAASNLNLEATNVRAHLSEMPIKEDTFGKEFQVNGFLWADNAKPQEIWDNVVLKSDKAFHIKVVSKKYYNNVRNEGSSNGFDLGDDLIYSSGQGTGSLLGYQQMDGKIPGCFQYAGFIKVVFTPVFQVVPAPSYDLEKTVDKTTAKPGDTINYTINVKNTGNVNLNNVKVTDKLPEYYSDAKEAVDSRNGSTGSIVKGGELTFKKLMVGETATIKVSYKIKDKDALACGETKITNKAAAITDEDTTEWHDDNNEVTTTVTKDCTPPVVKQPGYDISKAVDKTTAKPGETLKYTIKVANTGEVELTNVVVKDQLPANYSEATDKATSQNGSTGSIVKDGQVTFKKLNVGETATIEVTYKLKDAEQFACGNTNVVNKVAGTTDQDQTEDKTDNNEVTTVVSKECAPVVPPVTPPATTEQKTETPQTPAPQSPTTIAKTGAGDVAMSVLGLGSLAGATTAYIRSRRMR